MCVGREEPSAGKAGLAHVRVFSSCSSTSQQHEDFHGWLCRGCPWPELQKEQWTKKKKTGECHDQYVPTCPLAFVSQHEWNSLPFMQNHSIFPNCSKSSFAGHNKDVLMSRDIISLVTFVSMVDRRSANSSVSIGVSCRHNDIEKQDPESSWCLVKNST